MKTRIVDHTGDGGAIRVPATSENPAADAAAILARRMYGNRGTVVALREDSHAADWSSATYQAVIGRAPTARDARKYGSGVSGRNVFIYI